ncbi:MAG: winged helix DNA-binding protein [Reinekea sp.]|jgi:DNA-binding MarR family transcriptional regulator|nr:winged helix DNA-binding protein [Reinekea sp.]
MNKHDSAKQAFIQLSNTANWLQGKMTDILVPFQISVQQLRTLAIVAQMPERQATVKDIRQRMYDPMSNVSRLLNKLMEKQLIQKVRSAEDQRVVYIQLTDAGLKLLNDGQAALDQGMAALASLTTEQFKQLNQLLTQLRQ